MQVGSGDFLFEVWVAVVWCVWVVLGAVHIEAEDEPPLLGVEKDGVLASLRAQVQQWHLSRRQSACRAAPAHFRHKTLEKNIL